MSERDQPTIDAANELLRTTMTAAIYLPLADGKSAYLGGDSDIALMLADKDQSGAAVRGEAVAESDLTEMHPAWSRVILYTDSISGKQTCRDDLWAITGDELRALLAARLSAHAADAPSEPSDDPMPTDISMLLRQRASAPMENQDDAKLMLTAADECERFYGGMVAWKKTAQKKDRDWQAERMERCNDRIKSRTADALDSQPTEPDGCAECRHTYCMSGEVCKACGDVAMQGWKGGRQPTDGGVRNG